MADKVFILKRLSWWSKMSVLVN